MTNHWGDFKNANVVLLMGSNAAENHPIAWRHIWKAKEQNNAKIVSVDPRYTRTSAKADIYVPMRSGTDIVFLGGMIRYAIENNKYNTQYVKDCTNALFKVSPSFVGARDVSHPGNFSAVGTWDYDYDTDVVPPYGYPAIKRPKKAADLNDAACVFQKLKEHYSIYTPEMVERICGTPQYQFLEVCRIFVDGTYANDKAGTMLYAMGWTQHTVGSQNIRAATILQSLLGNMGVAGGGINALRGWHNVQGATDHALLYQYLPGYNSAPPENASYATLGTGPMDAGDTYLKKSIPLPMDPDSPTQPESSNWWGQFAYSATGQYNRARYVVSNLRAWWPNQAAATSYDYLPKRAADYSYLSLMKAVQTGTIDGMFVWGSNPMVMGPDQNLERPAMANLEWLVVCDLFHTETSDFWQRPGVDPSTISTTVYLLPGAAFYEKEGSVANSSRLSQWKDLGCAPPGDAKDELDIVNDLGAAIQTAYGSSGLPKNAPIENLAWPVGPLLAGTLVEKVAKEINGYALATHVTNYGGVTYTQGDQINSFFYLDSAGNTACGNWLYCGTWQKALNARTGNYNQMKNRRAVDDHPQQIGIYRDWGYSWPVNRRIIYNRAAVYQTVGPLGQAVGTPLNPAKQVVNWTGATWDGGCGAGQANDVVDGFGTAGPSRWLPFIMREEGVARLMSVKGGVADGPFPEHWEPKETPLDTNPLTSGLGPLSSPYLAAQEAAYGALYADTPSERDTYPIVCTTYRLTEHWHGGGMTRNLPGLAELQPEPFVEISEELAAAKGIANGDNVVLSSIRGSITVKACVTKRFKPFVIDGQTVHQVGMPWHWGYISSLTPPCTGASANSITPFIGDANTRIPEYKAFLVDIVKA